MRSYTDPPKLVDCRLHGRGSELLIVEGDSAAAAVVRLRDEATQAVLPMQGKPLNAGKASKRRVEQYPLFRALSDALQYPLELDTIGDTVAPLERFERIVLMFDPDADGIHSAALMMFFFYRAMRPLLDSQRIFMLKPPLFEAVVQVGSGKRASTVEPFQSLFAYTELEASRMLQDIRHAELELVSQAFYRGLASIPTRTLQSTCLDKHTRQLICLSASDAQAAQQIFSPQR